jgi:hypothetical protein
LGILIEGIKDTRGKEEDFEFEDGRITTDRYQKRQLLDILIFIIVLTESALCFHSVNQF